MSVQNFSSVHCQGQTATHVSFLQGQCGAGGWMQSDQVQHLNTVFGPVPVIAAVLRAEEAGTAAATFLLWLVQNLQSLYFYLF